MSVLPDKATLFLIMRIAIGKNMPRAVRVMRSITALGIALSVAALVAASAVGRGFEREYLRSLLDFNAHLIVSRQDTVPLIEDQMHSIVLALGDDMAAVTPFIYREALAVAKGSVRGVVVKGVDPKTVRDVNKMSFSTDHASLELALQSSEQRTPAVLGKVLSERMNAPDKIQLMVPAENGERFITLHSAGTFKSGIYDYDSQFIFMSLEDMRRLYGSSAKEVSGFEVSLHDPFKAKSTALSLSSMLGPNYDVTTWDDLNGELISAVRLERAVSAFIMGLMVVIATMNLIAVMLIGLVYRLPDFSIVRSLGLNDMSAAAVFTSQGLLTGAFGTLLGLIGGIGACALVSAKKLIPLDPEVYLIDSLPIDISPLLCGIVAVFSLVCALIAARIAKRSLVKVPIAEGLSRVR